MNPPRLMVAASGHDADMLYATRFYADDPFVWWEVRGKTHVALSPLEIDRAKPVARAKSRGRCCSTPGSDWCITTS